MNDPAETSLPVEGNPNSAVWVHAYEDLQCKDSAAWRRMLDDVLLPRYTETVAFAAYDFPLAKHAWAMDAAVVSRKMARTSPVRCLDFRRYCYEHLEQFSAESFPERIVDYAERAGLDAGSVSISVRNPDYIEAVNLDLVRGRKAGVSHTPTVIIGEQRFIEVFPAAGVIAAIDKALQS